MRKVIKKIASVAQIVLTAACFLVACIGAVYEFVGHKKFEELLLMFGIFNGFDTFVIISVIIIVLEITICFVNSKIQ